MCRSRVACSMSSTVDPGRRTPNDHCPLARSWACIAPNQRTMSAGVPAEDSSSSKLAMRNARTRSAESEVILASLLSHQDRCPPRYQRDSTESSLRSVPVAYGPCVRYDTLTSILFSGAKPSGKLTCVNVSPEPSPAKRPLLERIASTCFRRRRIVLMIWLLALPAAFAVSGALGGKFDDAQGGGSNTESAKATALIEKEFPQIKAQTNGQTGEIVFQVPAGIASKQTEITTWIDLPSQKSSSP